MIVAESRSVADLELDKVEVVWSKDEELQPKKETADNGTASNCAVNENEAEQETNRMKVLPAIFALKADSAPPEPRKTQLSIVEPQTKQSEIIHRPRKSNRSQRRSSLVDARNLFKQTASSTRR